MKILLSFLILFIIFVPFFASAQTEVVYPSLPGVVAPQDIIREAQNEKEILPLFIDYLFRLILVVSLIAVFGVILYAGILYLLSAGSPIKNKIAREWVLSAIQGTMIIFSSYALLYALDSQLVLFGLRNLEKGESVERIDLNWEIRNSYFQVPFGLLIEDAILNENAKNKLYDVLDATNEAEAVAEAIYQGSRQLLAIIETCPIGMPCGPGGAPVPNPPTPYNPPPPDDRDTENATVPPTEEAAEESAENEHNQQSGEAAEESAENEHNQQSNNDIYTVTTSSGTYEVWFEDPASDTGWSPIIGEDHFKEIDSSSIKRKLIKKEESSSSIYPFISNLLTIFKGFSFNKNIITVKAESSSSSSSLHTRNNHNNSTWGDDAAGAWNPYYRGPGGDERNYHLPNSNTGGNNGSNSNNSTSGNGTGPNGTPSNGTRPNGTPSNGTRPNGTPENGTTEPNGTPSNGTEPYGTPENGTTEPNGQPPLPPPSPPPPGADCCPSCPDIAPPVQAKIAEIEGYFPIFLDKLQKLFETKEPIKEDLFQLYKAVMIKSLGAQHLMNYNSLLFYRRYYEKKEIVIRTAEERTEIGRYHWDWTQWLSNLLYRIKVGNKIIEENDPATFYLRDPLAKKIVSDATRMALSAKEEGIQDAGSLIGIPRKMPPPPPDYGNKFYLPTNPEKTRITSPFGWRYDPFTKERVMHHGLDLAGPQYSPIYAAEKGEVVFAGWMGTKTTGYGKLIILYHKANEIDGLTSDVVTYYGHLAPNSFMVRRGDTVSRGQHIAGMGTTGRSTGYHLHYEVREGVRHPYTIHTGTQVDPASYIDIDYYSFTAPTLAIKSSVFTNILQKICIQEASAKTDMDILFEYLNENNIKVEDLTEARLIEILNLLEITSDVTPLLINPGAQPAADLLVCGMEIPVGETFELTWDHLVELLDTIDYYIAEGERLIQQQQLMNELSRPCSCPCVGECCGCDPPYCGGCNLTCDLGAIRAAHADVARTRQKLREIAAHIKLLTDGHFNTPTEELCDALNEDIRDDGELVLCSKGGSKLITKHELITRKLNYSRYSFDECITRPEHIEDTLEGARAGRIPFFGPIAEENNFERYTKTIKDGSRINTSDFNWFCCTDSKK